MFNRFHSQGISRFTIELGLSELVVKPHILMVTA